MARHIPYFRGLTVLLLLVLASCALAPSGGARTQSPTKTDTDSSTPTPTQEEMDALAAAQAWLTTGHDELDEANAFYGPNGIPYPPGSVAVLRGSPPGDYTFVNLRYDGYIYSNTGTKLIIFQTAVPKRGRAIFVVEGGTSVGASAVCGYQLASLNPFEPAPGGCLNGESETIDDLLPGLLAGQHVNIGIHSDQSTAIVDILRGASSANSPAIIFSLQASPLVSRGTADIGVKPGDTAGADLGMGIMYVGG